MAEVTKAAKKDKKDTKQISLVLDADLFAAIDEYHWTARKPVSAVSVDALREYAENHNLTVAGAAQTDPEVPAEAEKPKPGK